MKKQSHLPGAGSSEKLYYIRCKQDGSWLATDNFFHLVGGPANWRVERADAICVESFKAHDPASAYQAIDCTKALHEYVTEWVTQRGPLDFDALFRHVRAYCPFDLQRFEMSAMLNTMLRRGDLELEPASLTFKIGEHLNDCAACGSALESHGDCSNAECVTHGKMPGIFVYVYVTPDTHDGCPMPTTPDPMPVEQVGKHINEWLAQYSDQGYYRNARQQPIPLTHITFKVEQVTVGLGGGL